MSSAVDEDVRLLALRARRAAHDMGLTSGRERDAALAAMAGALRDHADQIVAANGRDVAAAQAAHVKESLIDRLMLDLSRVEAMADALEDLMDVPDPVGRTLEERTLANGIRLTRVSVPLGVIGIIYEARPNVTADAAGICIKSGNACILRGGSMAAHTNEVIADVLSQAACKAGMPQDAICAITSTDRAATDALMQLHGIVDVIVPRGGAGLIRHCVDSSKVPVIETGTGNCHIYVHESADLQKAIRIILNAKCRRYGVCNAAESLLLDVNLDTDAVQDILSGLADAGVLLHCDQAALSVAQSAGIADAVAADEADWGTEYLAPEISVKTITGGVDEAINHINRYGTGHSEAIIAEDAQVCAEFLAGVDAAAVYANASTAFTDGGQFGLGAEIGISTQKLHVRGPFACEALTSSKYILEGDGQVRP